MGMLMSFTTVWPLSYAESFKGPWDCGKWMTVTLNICWTLVQRVRIREREQDFLNLSRYYIVAVSNIYSALFTSSLPWDVCPNMRFYYIETYMCNISVVFYSGVKMRCNYDKHWPARHLPGMLHMERLRDAIRHLTAKREQDECTFLLLGFFLNFYFEKNNCLASLPRFSSLSLRSIITLLHFRNTKHPMSRILWTHN